MDQRISFLTLAVRDLEASRRFYVDGLGWTPDLEVEGDVIMIMAGEQAGALALGPRALPGRGRPDR